MDCASKLLSAVAKAYGTCSTYIDKGRLETHFGDGKRTIDEFQTHFKRPNLVKLSWCQNVGKRSETSAFFDGNTGHLCSGKKVLGLDNHASGLSTIGELLAASAGISSGLSTLIIPILLPDLAGFEQLPNLATVKFIEPSEGSDDLAVVHVSGQSGNYEIYIDSCAVIRKVHVTRLQRSKPTEPMITTTYSFLSVEIEQLVDTDAFRPS